MYEPYEEKKESRFKKIFDRIKERVSTAKLTAKNFRFQRFTERLPSTAWTIVAVVVLIVGGLSYTGYTVYTSKITETQSQLLILERQINALEDELNGYKTNLAVCEANLENTKKTLSKTEKDLTDTRTQLVACNTEYNNLVNASAATQTAYIELKNVYAKLQEDYKKIECSSAVSKECNYYTVSDSMVKCCVKIENKFYCGPGGSLTDEVTVRQVSEYC